MEKPNDIHLSTVAKAGAADLPGVSRLGPVTRYRCKADSRRITKCSHTSSAHVNRPFILLRSALAGIAHVQWPHVGFSINVRAGEK